MDPDGELSRTRRTSSTATTGSTRAAPADQPRAATEHRRRPTATATRRPARDDDRGDADTTGRDTSGPTTDDAMTRSEEELRIGTTERESGRARLRKYVVEDEVTETVPVQREEIRVEREPITDANVGDATGGPAISEEEHEVVLHEEEVVVDKQAVPKERIRLDKDAETEEQQVSETLRKEEVDVDGEADAR